MMTDRHYYRVNDPWVVAQQLAGGPRPVCGHWMMKSDTVCARRPGHRNEHRSIYAVDYDRDRKRRARAS